MPEIHPARIDLGLGRPAVDRLSAAANSNGQPPGSDQPAAASAPAATAPAASGAAATVIDGLLLPAPPRMRVNVERLRRQLALVGYRPGAEDEYGQQVRDIQAFLRGDYRTAEGEHLTVPAAEGADLQIWVLGSSAGASARTAGELGLPFVANYHVSPASVLAAVRAYRDAFVPSATFDRPYVMVSADVVVGPDDDTAAELASPYGLWVLSIRSGEGARPFLSPAEAAAHRWTPEERALVVDRVETQFVGGPATVARKLETLRNVTGADATITHDHADRVRSYELLAEEWH